MDKEQKSKKAKADIGLSLIETLRSPELANIAKDLGELALDAILEDGVLKDFPVFSAITGVAKFGIAVRDKLLVRKLYSFLLELQDISWEVRQKLVQDLNDNPQYQRKIGENLIMLLDRLDDLDKPPLVAKLFEAYIDGDINYNQFRGFSSIIERIFVYDLKLLLDDVLSERNSTAVAEHLYVLGISNIKFDDTLFVKTGSAQEILQQNKKNFFPKEPISFSLSNNAYLLVQIIAGEEKWGNRKDFVAANRRTLGDYNRAQN